MTRTFYDTGRRISVREGSEAYPLTLSVDDFAIDLTMKEADLVIAALTVAVAARRKPIAKDPRD